MTCKYVRNGATDGGQCQREATKGWTTCARHHSAGNSRKQMARIQKGRVK